LHLFINFNPTKIQICEINLYANTPVTILFLGVRSGVLNVGKIYNQSRTSPRPSPKWRGRKPNKIIDLSSSPFLERGWGEVSFVISKSVKKFFYVASM